jgi:hypothetical protein
VPSLRSWQLQQRGRAGDLPAMPSRPVEQRRQQHLLQLQTGLHQRSGRFVLLQLLSWLLRAGWRAIQMRPVPGRAGVVSWRRLRLRRMPGWHVRGLCRLFRGAPALSVVLVLWLLIFLRCSVRRVALARTLMSAARARASLARLACTPALLDPPLASLVALGPSTRNLRNPHAVSCAAIVTLSS